MPKIKLFEIQLISCLSIVWLWLPLLRFGLGICIKKCCSINVFTVSLIFEFHFFCLLHIFLLKFLIFDQVNSYLLQNSFIWTQRQISERQLITYSFESYGAPSWGEFKNKSEICSIQIFGKSLWYKMLLFPFYSNNFFYLLLTITIEIDISLKLDITV